MHSISENFRWTTSIFEVIMLLDKEKHSWKYNQMC